MGRDGAAFYRQYCLHNLDGTQNTEKVVEAFWKTFHWTLHYFQTNTPLNWDWVYPYPDAPLLKHILQFPETIAEKGLRTFGITQQLQFILPATSLRASKKLVKFPDEMYAETRHPWMKRHEWEMKPRISLPWNPTSALTEVSPL
jgi:5'-3' exonuclease